MRKKSETEIAYDKELKRIKQFIRRAEKRGYTFLQSKAPKTPQGIAKAKKYELPKRPKKITKASVNKLKKITAKSLYEKSVFTDPQTGEFVSGKSGKRIEKKRAAKKAATTKKARAKLLSQAETKSPTKEYIPIDSYGIINTVTRMLEKLEPWGWSASFIQSRENMKANLQSFWEDILDSEDSQSIANRLAGKSDLINSLIDASFYESGDKSVQPNYAALLEVLQGKMLDSLQQDYWNIDTP